MVEEFGGLGNRFALWINMASWHGLKLDVFVNKQNIGSLSDLGALDGLNAVVAARIHVLGPFYSWFGLQRRWHFSADIASHSLAEADPGYALFNDWAFGFGAHFGG